jgi:hypothetical protein
MSLPHRRNLLSAAWAATGIALLLVFNMTTRADNVKTSEDVTNMTVVVKEADSGNPISQARITLQFWQPGGAGRLGKARKLSYNSKTDSQGRCKLSEINKGTIILTVTATGHQSYGKELELDNDNQVFEVKLKKPQPLI